MSAKTLTRFILVSALWCVPDVAHAECNAPSGVCVRAGTGVGWKAGAGLSDKQRSAEARKHRKRSPANLSITIDGGRGSVFIDGIWVGVAPLQGLELLPGKHDLQVRDGTTVMAAGVLSVPKNSAGEIQLEVRHP